MDYFCIRLKELKEERKVTYQQIADYLGITLRHAKSYTAGEAKPDYYKLIALADYFQVSLDYLTGRDDVPNRKEQTHE